MHRTINTQGVVLSRTDFGEADRIIHFLTPDHGKVTGIAKGVRKSKSKLAGGIELFSVSELTFIVGKSEIYTIISARLEKHFDNITKELERTNVGYETIRLLNKATEDNPEPEYFNLLTHVFEALNISA
jgi:DNA repair protein RecO (recombination protein O)